MDRGIAVDLGGRGEQEARALRLGEAQRLVGAQRADLQGLDRQLQIVDGARRGREVEDTVELASHVDELGDVVLVEGEPVATEQVTDIVGGAGDQVVERHDLVSLGQEAFGQMRAQKARGSGDQDPHVTASRPSG